MKMLKMLNEGGNEVAKGEAFSQLVVEVSLAEYGKLRRHNDFINVTLYRGSTKLQTGEVGQIEDCRIVLAPEADNDKRAEMNLDYLRTLIDG